MSAASSLGLRGTMENGKSIIHPAAHRGCTCPLQGWGGWCPPLGRVWAVPTLGHHEYCHGPNGEQELYSCCGTTHSQCMWEEEISLPWRERKERLFIAAAWGDIPKTQLFSIRQQPCQWAVLMCPVMVSRPAQPVSTLLQSRKPHVALDSSAVERL